MLHDGANATAEGTTHQYLVSGGKKASRIGWPSGFKAGAAGAGMFSRHFYWETAEPPAMPTLIDAAKIPFE